MPRRSSRIKEKSQDAEELNIELTKDIDISIKTKEIESVSNNNTLQVNQTQNDKKLEIEQTEQKDFSEPQSIEVSPEQSPEQSPEKSPEQSSDPKPKNDEQSDEEVTETLVATRSRRNVKRMSYKDDSSSEEEGEEDDDPMFAGLSKEQKQAMKEKMAAIQKGANESTLKERALKIQEIIGAFELNIDAEVSEEEAAFIYDFSRKHQFDVIEKIEDEGDFFLDSMREMIEEKLKLHEAGIRRNGGKRKRKKDEESESEFDMNDFDDETDSDYSMDSDFENPFEDNENMIDEYEDEEDYASWGSKKRRGKRRRNKNIWRDESGREYYAKGRLLLTDALKDTVNFEGWSAARVKAWKNKEVNPNAYHYRFNLPGEEAINGPLRDSEIKPFMERVKEVGVNVHWGTFSSVIKGRVGYQCSNYWRQMMKDGWVKDPNYWVLPDGKFSFKRGKKHDIPENIRRYSFVVLKDPSGTFGPDFPAFHPKRPSDKQLKKYLETDVRDLDENVKAGKKKKSNKRKGRGKGKTEKTEKEQQETKDDDDDNKNDETTDNKKEEKEEGEKSKKKTSKNKKDKKKTKKKKKKKSKNKDGQDENEGNEDKEDNEENEESTDKKTKKKKKSKKSKKSSKKDKKKDKKSRKKKSKKSKKDKKGEETENDDDNNDEKEGESELTTKPKRGTKRKHSGGEPSELEPPQKKRKKMNKSKSKKNEKEMDIEQDPLSLVLGDMIDIMTGDKLVNPAISPYGYVMSYSSWCSILRNSKTKNQCPFTKQKLTRRSLVKLTIDNIDQYKDQIVNITEEQAKNLKL